MVTVQPRACDIEIYECPSTPLPGWAPVKPRQIRINGIEYFTPEETPVEVDDLLMVTPGELSNRVSLPVVTVTLFVADLRIGHSFSGREPRADDGKVHAAYLELVDSPSSTADHVRKVIGGTYLNGEPILLKGGPAIQILPGGLVLARLPLLVRTLRVCERPPSHS